ncbi:MAG TPA: YMGG-like glycine zipper-containing protein [Rhizomicrobium sp.]
MIRTTCLAALSLALMSATALAQSAGSASAPPASLSNPDNGNRGDYDDDYPPDQRDYPQDQRGYPQDQRGAPQNAAPQRTAEEQRSRDMFCRRDAAARTGYVTPGQAAGHEQANGTILGTLGGAALGAAIGAAAGNAGTGAAIGAGAGLIGGTAVGADNARRAAADVERDYGAAYYACMNEANYNPGATTYAGGGNNYGPGYGPPPPGYYPPPPPPAYYGYGPYPYPYPYDPYYYGPGYYRPGVSFGFSFGGGHRHWRH